MVARDLDVSSSDPWTTSLSTPEQISAVFQQRSQTPSSSKSTVRFHSHADAPITCNDLAPIPSPVSSSPASARSSSRRDFDSGADISSEAILRKECKKLREECRTLRHTLDTCVSHGGPRHAATAELLHNSSGTQANARPVSKFDRPQVCTAIAGTQTLVPQTASHSTQASPPEAAPHVQIAAATQTADSPHSLAVEKDALIVIQARHVRDLNMQITKLKDILEAERTRAAKACDMQRAERQAVANHAAEVENRLDAERDAAKKLLREKDHRIAECEDEVLLAHKRAREEHDVVTRLNQEIAHLRSEHEAARAAEAENTAYLKSLLEKMAVPVVVSPKPPTPAPAPERLLLQSTGTDTDDLVSNTILHSPCDAQINDLEDRLQNTVTALSAAEAAHRVTMQSLKAMRTTSTALKTQLIETQTAHADLTTSYETQTKELKKAQHLHSSLRTQLSSLQTQLIAQKTSAESAISTLRSELTKSHRAELKRTTELWAGRVRAAQEAPSDKPTGHEKPKPRLQDRPTRHARLITALERAVAAWVWAAAHKPRTQRRAPIAMPTHPPAMIRKMDRISRSILNVSFQTIISPPPISPATITPAAQRIAEENAKAAALCVRDICQKHDFETDLVKYLCDLWVRLTHDF
ncbi:hypothetical protein HDU88_004121 [Geranomyces variabilis]|nr:hypothetical protein HDU88_004121 [Geranomyces variabilis]